MNIAVLSSSRADYSLYLPLLKKLEKEDSIKLNIVAFGTHLSKNHGYTINEILYDGFEVSNRIETIVDGDGPNKISTSIGRTIVKFSKLWESHNYDLVLALGDRYEMFGAVMSTVPYNIKIGHIHGGETTLGAIDNIFRDSITLASKYHFCTTDIYSSRISKLLGTTENIFNVGALSIDNLSQLQLFTIPEFLKNYEIDLSKKSILITFHPETVSFERNDIYVKEFIGALMSRSLLDFQKIITMPNADTRGDSIRKKLLKYIESDPQAFAIENFGTIGYLSCMKYCSFMLGNSSSGFVEASYFPKYVINVGSRQKGRIVTPNILNCDINKSDIVKSIDRALESPKLEPITLYGNGNAASKILKILKNL